ncbi:outer membrane insertion C-terminal signal [Flavobacteriaceae bacterium MAR_2010_188]|nr:outer membrane insertion C-terminal signal [Flavobacteriaceae bacterium MAR_2010_188]
MKYFKLFLLLMLFSTAHKGMAQLSGAEKPWIVGLSYNVVDDSSLRFKEFFNISEHWNTIFLPTTLNVEYMFSEKFSAESALSYNRFIPQYEKFYTPPSSKKSYIGFDLNAKFYFLKNDILREKEFMPYVMSGFGYSTVDSLNWFHFNFGLGVSYWFNPLWGAKIQSTGKWTLDLSDSTNYKHHMIGIMYLFAE